MAASKKRKRDSLSNADITCKLSDPLVAGTDPVLVNFPAIQGPSSMAFQRYARKKTKTIEEVEERPTDDQDTMIVGETEAMEFVSNEMETQRVANAGCRYLIAVFDRETSALSILPASKSPFVLNSTVKNLKSTPLPVATSLQFQEAKTALGEAFGTKKAKANLRALQRSRVDVGAMEGVIDFLQQGIDKGGANLLTKDEAAEVTDSNRLIPPFDASATDPAEIYPLHHIIPEVEWNAWLLSPYEAANTHKEKAALLPHKASDWILSHIKGLEEKLSKAGKKHLKIILYISAMFAFRRILQFKKGGIDKDYLAQKMSGVPRVITESLLAKFTEIPRGSTTHQTTPKTELYLLSHIFSLCLKVDNFATDYTLLAHDLSLPPGRVKDIFKSLGCKIQILSDRERAQYGVGGSAANTKYAVLAAPLTFPKPRTLKRSIAR